MIEALAMMNGVVGGGGRVVVRVGYGREDHVCGSCVLFEINKRLIVLVRFLL